MAKLKDTEILTQQVYLNIENEQTAEVETKGMTTKEAIAEHGELEVIEVGEPQYSNTEQRVSAASPGRNGRKEEQDTRKPGTTAVRLRAAG